VSAGSVRGSQTARGVSPRARSGIASPAAPSPISSARGAGPQRARTAAAAERFAAGQRSTNTRFNHSNDRFFLQETTVRGYENLGHTSTSNRQPWLRRQPLHSVKPPSNEREHWVNKADFVELTSAPPGTDDEHIFEDPHGAVVHHEQGEPAAGGEPAEEHPTPAQEGKLMALFNLRRKVVRCGAVRCGAVSLPHHDSTH
jgi:hypothetical protein